MATVYVKENESVDSAFRRWKRKCSNDGIIGDLKRHEVYEKPSVRRKKKAENARKRKYFFNRFILTHLFAQLFSSEQMYMNVLNALASVGSDVSYQSETVFQS